MKVSHAKKQFLIFFFCFVGSIFLPRPAFATEKINRFESEIIVQKDATVLVTEIIVYDFGAEKRHGIFREIPVIYKNEEGKKFKIDFQVLSVKDEKEISYQYEQTKSGENVSLKIGDSKRTISGEKTYIISYQVKGATTYFSDHDELFWNVTGNNWPVSIFSATASIKLPEEITDQIQAICFIGPFGAKEKNCQFAFKEVNRVVISTTDSLRPYEGLSLAISFPKNFIAYVEPKAVGLSTSIKVFLITLATLYYLIGSLLILYLWLKYGRDPRVGKPVRAWYDPPRDQKGEKLTPAEVGTLVDEYANERDLSATIVDLAIRDYLKIKQEEKEYTFIKRKDFQNDQSLKKHERMILENFFKDKDEASTKTLKKSFYKTSQKIMDHLYKVLVDKGFFPENPKSVRNKFYLISVLGFITLNFPLGILAFLFGRVMPRKTLFGAQSKVQAFGLKNFLSSQERQLEFQEKNWHFFEKLLPYAIVFNVAQLWAKRFEGIVVEPPDWYEGEYKGSFSPTVFTHSILASASKFESASIVSTSTRSTTRFSSGFSHGSSGGGFGGGGGGSW